MKKFIFKSAAAVLASITVLDGTAYGCTVLTPTVVGADSISARAA